MKSNRPDILSQAATSRTWKDYQLKLALLAMKGLFGKWIPGVLMFLFAVLIKFLQDHYDFTVRSRGWALVYLPYLGVLLAGYLYHILRASWLVHKETAKEIAKMRIAQLDTQGAWLQGKAPIRGNANESIFCQFWAEEAKNWSDGLTRILWDNYGEDVARDFTSNTGLNPLEDVGTIHPEAAAAYRTLVHQRKTLQNIRRNLRG